MELLGPLLWLFKDMVAELPLLVVRRAFGSWTAARNKPIFSSFISVVFV